MNTKKLPVCGIFNIYVSSNKSHVPFRRKTCNFILNGEQDDATPV